MGSREQKAYENFHSTINAVLTAVQSKSAYGAKMTSSGAVLQVVLYAVLKDYIAPNKDHINAIFQTTGVPPKTAFKQYGDNLGSFASLVCGVIAWAEYCKINLRVPRKKFAWVKSFQQYLHDYQASMKIEQTSVGGT